MVWSGKLVSGANRVGYYPKSAMAIGKDNVDIRYGGFIYRWNADAGRWDQVGGLAVAVSVSPAGVPWVVNAEGKIFEMVNQHWVERPGYSQRMRANDIGIGHNGVVMIIGARDGDIYQWNGFRWQQKCGFNSGASRIDVDYAGNPWVVTASGCVFEGTMW